MATKAESKIDAAAEQAYAEAAAKKSASREEVSIAKVAEAVEADTPAPKKAAAKKASAKKATAKKVAVKKTAKKTPKKTLARKAAPKKTVAAKASAEKAPAKKTVKTATAKLADRLPNPTELKDTIMTNAKTKTADYSAKMQEGLADLQTRAKTAYDKSGEVVAEMGEFTKGNVEAVVESGKILANGMQDMAKTYVEDGKAAVSVVTADAKDMAAVKSPTEFVQLQGKIASRNFDATVAQVSKTTEAWVKLANDAFAPLSNRMSVAMEKVRKAA